MKLFTHENWRIRQEEMWKGFLEWHPWFAWRPVQLADDTWVWLERVQRRRYVSKRMKCAYWEYQP